MMIREVLENCIAWMVEHGCSHEYVVLKNARKALDSLAVEPSEDAREFGEELDKAWRVWLGDKDCTKKLSTIFAALITTRDERIGRESPQEEPGTADGYIGMIQRHIREMESWKVRATIAGRKEG